MQKTSMLLLPRPALAGCVFAAIARDTRGVTLCDMDRLNHFPASPLVALTYQHTGQTHIVGEELDFANIHRSQTLPQTSVAGPQQHPTTSWNPSAIFAVTIGFYPDAWSRLTSVDPAKLTNQMTTPVPNILAQTLDSCKNANDPTAFWQAFQDGLTPLWTATKNRHTWTGQHQIADWAQSLIVRAATSGVGHSLRAAERRLRSWTGHNKQSLAFYAKIEQLHRLVKTEDTASLAGLAHLAGYADQSHMGRAVRRATGHSPAQLNKLIATQESFWCYRLLGERF